MLDAALAYARAGWPVFPCDPRQDAPGTKGADKRAKRPLVKGADRGPDGKQIPQTGGLWRATTDEDQIRAWWGRWPEALIGVPTGSRVGAFVVDLDPRDEPLSVTLARLTEAVGSAPMPGPQSVTQSGGLHLWFAMPEGETPKNSAKRLAGVDWRGEGGYVIAPPSRMSDGASYRWIAAPSGLADAIPCEYRAPLGLPWPRLADLVFQRGDFASASASATAGPQPRAAPSRLASEDPGDKAVRLYARAALERAAGDVADAVQGTRGHTLNAAAFGMGPFVSAGALSEREVYAALADAADACGLTSADGTQERDKKISRGLESGQAKGGGDLGRRLDEIREDAREKARRAAGRPPPIESYDGPDVAPYEPHDWGSASDRHDLGGPPPAYEEEDPGPDAAGPPADAGVDRIAEACAELDHSDTDNGRRLIAHFGEDLAVLAHEGVRNDEYVVWTGTHWDMAHGRDAAFSRAQEIGGRILLEARHLKPTPDEGRAIAAGDKRTATEVEKDSADDARDSLEKRRIARRKFGVSSKNKARLEGMLACAAPHLTKPPEAWNADPFKVACRTHTLTFLREPDPENPGSRSARVVAFQGHNRDDLMTRVMPVDYDPDAPSGRWRAFLNDFLPDASVRNFVQTFSGIGLTGLAIQKLLFHYGVGANGKSVFLEVLTRVLGDLAVTLQSETVTGMAERSAQAASPDLARLYGKWVVRVPELPPNEPVREALVKKLTGGEAIQARNLFKGQFDFRPLAKAHMSGNGFPRIDGTDNGIWRRIAVIEWPRTLAEHEQRDFDEVVGELLEERSGILNWLIDGALIYLADGLVTPEAIRHATQDYRDDMDPVGRFVAACVTIDPDAKTPAREVFEAYERWSEASGEKPRTSTAFGRALKTKVKRDDTGAVRMYACRLHDVPPPRNPGFGNHF